jgi:hypothetical protein
MANVVIEPLSYCADPAALNDLELRLTRAARPRYLNTPTILAAVSLLVFAGATALAAPGAPGARSRGPRA